jgi:hypothetical protein
MSQRNRPSLAETLLDYREQYSTSLMATLARRHPHRRARTPPFMNSSLKQPVAEDLSAFCRAE